MTRGVWQGECDQAGFNESLGNLSWRRRIWSQVVETNGPTQVLLNWTIPLDWFTQNADVNKYKILRAYGFQRRRKYEDLMRSSALMGEIDISGRVTKFLLLNISWIICGPSVPHRSLYQVQYMRKSCKETSGLPSKEVRTMGASPRIYRALILCSRVSESVPLNSNKSF